MIETKQIFDAFNNNTISNLIDYYNNIGIYDTTTMNKAPPGEALNSVKDLLESYIGKKLEYVQGNFYKHCSPYLPHTDYKTYYDGNINIVIPLMYTTSLPNLVIFDQFWDLDSVTWCMHLPVQRFEINIGVKGCPSEYPVGGLKSHPIDNDLYEKHLTHYPKNTLFGLSGNAYPFEPGSFIIFDTKRIHCTARMAGEKLGLTLRFK